MTAKSKAEATARMYELAGEPVEPLGPGSKEKRSALEALGRVVGLDLVGVKTKVECGRQIAGRLDVAWDLSCYSAGDSITLTGMNRLLDEIDREGYEPSALGACRPSKSGSDEVANVDLDLERRIAESIAELTKSAESLEDRGAIPAQVDSESIQFGDGSWRTALAAVAEWLRLAVDLDLEPGGDFDGSLAQGLGLADGWTLGSEDALRERLFPRLADRLDRAISLRDEFVDKVQDAEEGAPRTSARVEWSEAWDELDEEDEVEGGGPIHAEAATWAIADFVGHATDDELNLSPSYQRADVWPTSSSQLLVESILRGIPLPSIIILERVDDNRTSYEVVDGKQRLTSILRFMGCHPRAVELVQAKAEEWDEPDLLTIFQEDYPTFKRLWKKNDTVRLTAQAERLFYFPFPLRSGDVKPLSGELAGLRGKYYCQVKDATITVLGQPRPVRYVFEKASSTYKLPVITYKQVQSEQIHEVFSLYNKQGKHLNAEEIRNALYHHLALMKALVVTAGDSGTVELDAPFLQEPWHDLQSTHKVLETYGFGQAGYKRTKLLSWVSSVLLFEDGSPEGRSTANHINAMLKRVERDRRDPLRDEAIVRDAMVILDKGLDAHAAIPPETWAKTFVNSLKKGKWQELQLVASLIGLSAAHVAHGETLSAVVNQSLDALDAASHKWVRPTKTQSREQWLFIAQVVGDLLEVLDVSSEAVDGQLRKTFGASGLQALVDLRKR